MELKETVELMTSPDYKERFCAEYAQTLIRYNKLLKMTLNWNSLPFTPTCSREIYDRQLRAMLDYLSVLEERAKIEKIELDDIYNAVMIG